jgi:hypothetical protein
MRIAPVTDDHAITASAWNSLLGRLRTESVVKIGRWKRDELYG